MRKSLHDLLEMLNLKQSFGWKIYIRSLWDLNKILFTFIMKTYYSILWRGCLIFVHNRKVIE